MTRRRNEAISVQMKRVRVALFTWVCEGCPLLFSAASDFSVSVAGLVASSEWGARSSSFFLPRPSMAGVYEIIYGLLLNRPGVSCSFTLLRSPIYAQQGNKW